MRKKSLILTVVLAMMLAMAGCGNAEKPVNEENAQVTQAQKETDAEKDKESISKEDTADEKEKVSENKVERNEEEERETEGNEVGGNEGEESATVENEVEGSKIGIAFTEFEPTEEMFMNTFQNPRGYEKSKYLFAEQVVFKLPEEESMYRIFEIEVISSALVQLSDYEVFFENDAYKGVAKWGGGRVYYYLSNKYTEWGLRFIIKFDDATREQQEYIKMTFDKALEECLTGQIARGEAPELQQVVDFNGNSIEWNVRDTLGMQAIGYNPIRVIDLLYASEAEPEKYSEALSAFLPKE